jgi:hypothetical protein
MSQKRLLQILQPNKIPEPRNGEKFTCYTSRDLRRVLQNEIDEVSGYSNYLTSKRNQKSTSKSQSSIPKPRQEYIDNFIQSKRTILMSKLRLDYKRKHLKEMKDEINYKEKEQTIRMKDFEEDLSIMKKNFMQQKKEIEILIDINNGLEAKRISKLKVFQDLKKITLQKENEINYMDEKISTHISFRQFVKSVFKYVHRPFEEKSFLKILNSARRGVREGFESHKSWQSVLKKVKAAVKEPSNPFFITASKILERKGLYTPIDVITQVLDDFIDMVNSIEKEQIELFHEIQTEEANIIDITSETNS